MKKGFTLVELLVIVGIIMIILAILTPAIMALRVTSGKIIDKDYQSPYTEHEVVMHGIGDAQIPMVETEYHPEKWTITIKGEKGLRNLTVSRNSYLTLEIGDYVRIEDGVPVKLEAEQ